MLAKCRTVNGCCQVDEKIKHLDDLDSDEVAHPVLEEIRSD